MKKDEKGFRDTRKGYKKTAPFHRFFLKKKKRARIPG